MFSCIASLCKFAPNRKYLHKISILPLVTRILSGADKCFLLNLAAYQLQNHKKIRINDKLEVQN